MARYEDYVKDKNDDALQAEIDSARRESEKRKEISESVRKRFDGKSVDDVLEAYENLEKEKSRLGNEIHKLRTTADQLIELQIQQETQNNSRQDDREEVEPLTSDDLYEDPDAAIGRAVETRTKDRFEKIEQQLTQAERERAVQRLEAQFEGWHNEVTSPEFIEWVKKSKYRQRLAQAADAYDLDAANDLLEAWYDTKSSTEKQEQEQRRQKQLDAASLESSSPEGMESEVTFSRHDLMQRRIRAAHGDLEAKDWLQANSRAIAKAYAEDRITD